MTKTDKRTRRGAALIIAIAIMTVLLAIGLTFFTVARVESVTAMNVVNTVRAEHLVDAGFAMAEYQLNRDLTMHPQVTSLDHGWRTLFNGAAFAGKKWANSTGVPAFNLEPIERKLREAGILPPSSLLYVKYRGGYMEPLFRGPRTSSWLAIPRWQGDDILIYPRPEDGQIDLCNAAGVTIADSDINTALSGNTEHPIVRFVDYPLHADGTPATRNAGLYPFVTTNFYGPVARYNKLGEFMDHPWDLMAAESLWMPEQVDRWADVDTNGDGMRESIWVPLPKDVDLSYDGVDNDLDGVPDPESFDKQASQIVVDEEGNPRRDFEIGSFVYRIDDNTGRIVRAATDITGPTSYRLTIPLPGLRLPVDMNNDGRIDMGDCYNTNGLPDPTGSPVYVTLPDTVNVPTAGGGSTPLNISAVDSLDSDYDQFVNGFNAYVFLGEPNNTTHDAPAADSAAQKAAGAPIQYDATNARTKFANKIIRWHEGPDPKDPSRILPGILPNITFSANAPAWLTAPAAGTVPPVVISLTGEPVCDIVGRAAIHVVDESSKVNMNAAGAHIYRDDLDKTNSTAGQHIARAFNEGASTFEYETRALPDMGVDRASNLWGMLAGAGSMLDPPTGSKWDYSVLPVEKAALPMFQAPLQAYVYDISLPGYGRVDDNMNALLLAFNGRADAGNQHPDQGLWVPPLGALALAVLGGTDPTTLTVAQQKIVASDLSGYPVAGMAPITAPYAEVAKQVINPSFKEYYNLLGMLEGIDDPAELQTSAPLRNVIAETDKRDNNSDTVVDEIGEAGDRLLANNYELQKAVEKDGSKIFGDLTWAKVKNVTTANSDSRNVNYIDSAAGLKALNKIDPNLAPPAQLAAGLLIKGDITPITDGGLAVAPGVPPNSDEGLFAEGLRQADTSLQGPIFTENGITNTNTGAFPADRELQAMQTAVNIADSRDADCARSLLVTDKKVSAATYQAWYGQKYGVAPFPIIEALNERERIDKGDAFPVGDLQDYLISAIGGTAAGKRIVSVDDWWGLLTSNAGQREDRTISYAAAGVDAIRINEMMVRPVRRIEAEAVTHMPDPAGTGLRVPLWSLYPNVPFDKNNLNPTPYPGMPTFDLDTIVGSATQWSRSSPYDVAPTAGASAASYPYALGDETAMVYTVPPTVTWVPETASNEEQIRNNINDDIIEFRIRTTADGNPQGLPPGRYYLTVNVVDPTTGLITVDDVDQLQYSIKYTNSTFNYPITGGMPSIAADIAFIDAFSPAPNDTAAIDEQNQLRADYFEHYWQTVDQPEFIATANRRDLGSGAPAGWVFAPAKNPDIPLRSADYLNLAALVIDGAAILQKMFDIPAQPDPLNPTIPLLADAPYCWSQSYFRDGIMPFGTYVPVGADQPATVRTFTVIVPPNNPTATPYDTVCIAFRLKPVEKNLFLRDPVTHLPAINPATGNPYPGRLAINFLDFSQQPDHEYVELANTTDKAVDLTGWTLEVGIPDPVGMDEDQTMHDPFKSRWTLEKDPVTGAPPVIAPKGYLLLGFDKVDKFQIGGAANLLQANGMGLAAGSVLAGLGYVTEPPIAGTAANVAYAPLNDATASVFRRDTASDYIDNDGDGVSSAPFVYDSTLDPPGLDMDTDGVAVEAKWHGAADGVVPPFARIVQLRCDYLWSESPTPNTSPYALDSAPKNMDDISAINPSAGIKQVAQLVLRGGILPDYPEHDGYDNDGDGGFLTKDSTVPDGFTSNPLLRYVRGTLDKDMVDNNMDGRIDENGHEQMLYLLNSGGAMQWVQQSGNPLHSEGVDEGRFATPIVQPRDNVRPRAYGFGSFEEGELRLQFTPSVTAYRYWEQALHKEFFDVSNSQYMFFRIDGITQALPENGFPYDPVFFSLPYSAAALSLSNPAVFQENPVNFALPASPEWKAFNERRWNPGDNVIVTLYVGPAAARKVADRASYRELDVINRAVDDIQECPYFVDGYRDFTYFAPDTSTLPPAPAYARWNGGGSLISGTDRVCLDRNRPQYWLPNQMGLDFYRSLERKHPLYPGDKFGTSNRWEATDGSYDDWSDSLSVFEAVENRSQMPAAWFSAKPLPLRSVVPGASRLFGHALYGSPLRMNTQQRLWDNPPDLVAYQVALGTLTFDAMLNEVTQFTAKLDAPSGSLGKRRQFVESDSVSALGQPAIEDRAYGLRRAEVRNRPFGNVGDLMKLPMLAFSVPLNTGLSTTTSTGTYDFRSTNAALNTRWLPGANTVPTLPSLGSDPALWAWRQDTTLAQTVMATSSDTKGTGVGFAALTELADINPLTLTVGQARFRPIWPNPGDTTTVAPAQFDLMRNLHWNDGGTTNVGTAANDAQLEGQLSHVKAPHCWSPVMLFDEYPLQSGKPAWSALPRSTVAYPSPLPVGTPNANKVTWDPPASWYRWNSIPIDAPYLVQAEFLTDPDRVRMYPVLGNIVPAAVPAYLNARWPLLRPFPPNASPMVPLENAEYPRAVMYVSQHDDNLHEDGRAEGIFSWDANDGLENGTYIAYVATYVPRMGQSLREADTRVIEASATGTGTAFKQAIMPQQSDPTNLPVPGNTDLIAAKLCRLDPALPHADGDDRFEPVLALEFVTDPAVADRVAPPRTAYTPDPARPLAALPHPKDWFPANTTATGDAVQTAAAYHADGDGMILYSGSGQVTWRARLVRVTDRFLALRVRNLGQPWQVACITGVVLAPARHVAGKINVNTAENERTIGAVNSTAKTYSFSFFNTLLGLPGVVDALSSVRNPELPDKQALVGLRPGPETPVGWPTATGIGMKSGSGDVQREPWVAPDVFMQSAIGMGLFMPPRSRTDDAPNNLLAPLDREPNQHDDWGGGFEGVAAMRLSSMIMAGRKEHFDARYYENAAGLATGAGKGGKLGVDAFPYPLSNESVPEWRFDEIDRRFGRMANLITTRSDVFEILVTVQAGNGADANGDNRIDYRDSSEFTVSAESQGRVIYERRARNDRSDEAAR